MARTSKGRAIVISPASNMTNFLKVGYATTGVATGSLLSLSPIFDSPSLLQLANLTMNMSPRSQRSSRAGSQSGDDEDEPELAFQVVVFKKITNERVPFGLDVDTITKFFTGLFTFSNQERRDEFEKTTKNLIGNPKHHFLAITALVFDADVQDIVHTIIAASLYTHDQSNGSFIFNLGVLERGDPKVVC